MASFPTGVTVVASRSPEGRPVGLTVNSFTSVSLEPPLVLVCIDHGATSHDPIVQSEGFAVSVLADDQADVAIRFSSYPSEGRFEDVDWHPTPSGYPVVAGAAAWIDCSLHEVIRAGDHSIVLGRATACGANEVPALLFHSGTMRSTDG
jgi:flavin reductase (DIM6/NTAB) family NADH-FMN oxidoreductase RutF